VACHAEQLSRRPHESCGNPPAKEKTWTPRAFRPRLGHQKHARSSDGAPQGELGGRGRKQPARPANRRGELERSFPERRAIRSSPAMTIAPGRWAQAWRWVSSPASLVSRAGRASSASPSTPDRPTSRVVRQLPSSGRSPCWPGASAASSGKRSNGPALLSSRARMASLLPAFGGCLLPPEVKAELCRVAITARRVARLCLERTGDRE